jgi:hypothetical protein
LEQRLKKDTVKTALTVVLGCALAFLVVGTSPSFQACIHEQQQQAGHSAFKENVGAFLIFFYGAGRGCGGEWLHNHGEAVIALFTVILGIATWLLWRATKRLVEGADRTAERQLRAYVLPDRVVATVMKIGQAPEIKIQFRNSGQTPAYQLMNNTFLDIRPVEAPDRVTVTADWNSSELSRNTIAPNSKFFSRTKMEWLLTQDHCAAIRNGEYVFCVQGEIRYTDAFGHKRTTKYKYVMDRFTDVREGRMMAAGEGNESD